MKRWLRTWSPWHLRRSLGDVVSLLNDDRGMGEDNLLKTAIERAYRFAWATRHGIDGDEAWETASRYSVKGRTLTISVTHPAAPTDREGGPTDG